MTKREIINDFLSDTKRNYTVFNTSYEEISELYDGLSAWLKQNKTFQNWLVTESAMHPDGRVRFDRQAELYDKESQKTKTVDLVFKYFIYNYLFTKIKQQKNDTTTTAPNLSEKWKLAVHGKSQLLHER